MERFRSILTLWCGALLAAVLIGLLVLSARAWNVQAISEAGCPSCHRSETMQVTITIHGSHDLPARVCLVDGTVFVTAQWRAWLTEK